MSNVPGDGKKTKIRWCLEGISERGEGLVRVPLNPMPFRIGRRSDLELSIPSASVSKVHAEIYEKDGVLHLRDFSSTNGTYVNRQRITDVPLRDGDSLRFANVEFRLSISPHDHGGAEPSADKTVVGILPEWDSLSADSRKLIELMRDTAVKPVFQPIVTLPNGELAAYEVLGRGTHPELPDGPGELFRLAAASHVEAALCRLFRDNAARCVGDRADLPPLFFNMHPAELADGKLLQDLAKLRQNVPHTKIVLEIHEAAVTELARIARLKHQLASLRIGLAYDDFGSGQARLVELVQVPPDYLKFDMRFVHGIDKARASMRQLVRSLLTVARDLRVNTVAEGIETRAEANVCASLGFTHGQGNLFGEPVDYDRLPTGVGTA
jgi:EAL domain-containing protein (putative c-di-GMP-specific phosphodiesterase class I)